MFGQVDETAQETEVSYLEFSRFPKNIKQKLLSLIKQLQDEIFLFCQEIFSPWEFSHNYTNYPGSCFI